MPRSRRGLDTCPTVRSAQGTTFNGEVEATEPVACHAVCAALEDDGARLIHLHDLANNLATTHCESTERACACVCVCARGTHRLEHALVGLVVDTTSEREVHGVILAFLNADILPTDRQSE